MNIEAELRDLKVEFMDALGDYLDLCIATQDFKRFQTIVVSFRDAVCGKKEDD